MGLIEVLIIHTTSVILFSKLNLTLLTKSIIEKEKMLDEGKLVLLRLARADSRSLVQGDYVRLRYEISRDLSDDVV